MGETPNLSNLSGLHITDFRAYLAHKRRGEKPLSPASVNRQLSAFRTFFSYLNRRWGVENSALANIKGPKKILEFFLSPYLKADQERS